MSNFNLIPFSSLSAVTGARARLATIANSPHLAEMHATRGQLDSIIKALALPMVCVLDSGGVMMSGARFYPSVPEFIAATKRPVTAALEAPPCSLPLALAAKALLGAVDGMAMVMDCPNLANIERESVRAALESPAIPVVQIEMLAHEIGQSGTSGNEESPETVYRFTSTQLKTFVEAIAGFGIALEGE
jgi:hypothetical protein